MTTTVKTFTPDQLNRYSRHIIMPQVGGIGQRKLLDIKVVPLNMRLTSENIMEVIEPYDIIVDGTDNFPTRYLVNDACYLAKKPNVHGSIFMFDGQVAVFEPGKGCYRCLYPAPPPPGM